MIVLFVFLFGIKQHWNRRIMNVTAMRLAWIDKRTSIISAWIAINFKLFWRWYIFSDGFPIVQISLSIKTVQITGCELWKNRTRINNSRLANNNNNKLIKTNLFNIAAGREETWLFAEICHWIKFWSFTGWMIHILHLFAAI